MQTVTMAWLLLWAADKKNKLEMERMQLEENNLMNTKKKSYQ